MSFSTKQLKITCSESYRRTGLVLLLSAYFFIITANFALAEDKDPYLWNREECEIKCAQLGDEVVSQLERNRDQETCNPDCKKEYNAEIGVVKSRFSTNKDGKSAYCINLAGQPATTDNRVYCYAPPFAVSLQIKIGETKVVYGLLDYIVKFFTWGTKAVAFLAVIMIMISGLQWLTSAGRENSISQAKERIRNSVVGLVLVLGSVFLLNLINPKLTDLSNFQIKMVPTITQGTFWCGDMDANKNGKVFQLKSDKTIATGISATSDFIFTKQESPKNQSGACGSYYESDDKSDSCYGNNCFSKGYCFRLSINSFQCLKAAIFGNFNQNVSRIILWSVKETISSSIEEAVGNSVKTSEVAYSFHCTMGESEPPFCGMLDKYSFYFIYSDDSKPITQYIQEKKDDGVLGYFLEVSLDKSIWNGLIDPELAIGKDGQTINNYDRDALVENWKDDYKESFLFKGDEFTSGVDMETINLPSKK